MNLSLCLNVVRIPSFLVLYTWPTYYYPIGHLLSLDEHSANAILVFRRHIGDASGTLAHCMVNVTPLWYKQGCCRCMTAMMTVMMTAMMTVMMTAMMTAMMTTMMTAMMTAMMTVMMTVMMTAVMTTMITEMMTVMMKAREFFV